VAVKFKGGNIAVSIIKAEYKCDVQKVWDTVTSLDNYSWRTDIDRIERVSENQFTEYTKDGFATHFTITVEEACKRREFDIDNENIWGHWTGEFNQKNGFTEIIFTEDVTAKKLLMKPFVKAFLKKQQAQYADDLRKVLEE